MKQAKFERIAKLTSILIYLGKFFCKLREKLCCQLEFFHLILFKFVHGFREDTEEDKTSCLDDELTSADDFLRLDLFGNFVQQFGNYSQKHFPF